jgi:hypothetical protein
MGALLATSSHLGGKPATLDTVIGVISVVGEGATVAVGPNKRLDLERRGRLRHDLPEIR